jgi:hypothetical protein
MDSLIVRAAATVTATLTAFADGDVPKVPSTPVEIGTGVTLHGHPQSGAWKILILMLVAAIVVGTVVLVYVVRQRRKHIERRQLRRLRPLRRTADAPRPARADRVP